MDKSVTTQILLYKSPNGDVRLEAYIQNETIWLNQKQIAELFSAERSVITKHISNVFKEHELNRKSVSAIFAQTAKDNKVYKTLYYNLDAIIAVGYRVNSKKATQFRIWATKILREYIIKGFVMDDERLKDPYKVFGQDYFDEQLERIRDIRSSERRFYQKITDIYSKCSIDYDPESEITESFFATVQNKLHFAITGKTASEIIYTRVSNKKSNLGLTSWKYSPKGTIRKSDTSIAKNYLNKEELDGLNRIVTMYLDYAEAQAKKRILMTMQDWINRLDSFLKFNEKEVLMNLGKISHKLAIEKADDEFSKFRLKQNKSFVSDFDKFIKKTIKQ